MDTVGAAMMTPRTEGAGRMREMVMCSSCGNSGHTAERPALSWDGHTFALLRSFPLVAAGLVKISRARGPRKDKEEVVKGGIEFVVEKYREILQMGVGQCVTSESFKVGGYEWAVMAFPHGDSEANGDYLSLFVALASEGRHVPAYYTFTLVDQSWGGADLVQGRSREQGPCKFEQRGWWVGFKRFMKYETLLPSHFMKGNSIRVRCVVEVVLGDGAAPPAAAKSMPAPRPVAVAAGEGFFSRMKSSLSERKDKISRPFSARFGGAGREEAIPSDQI